MNADAQTLRGIDGDGRVMVRAYDADGNPVEVILSDAGSGLALSDTSLRVATPHETIRRKKFTHDVNLLMEEIDKHDVSALVIGLPLNLDGSEGPRTQATRAFVRNMRQHMRFEVC